MKNFLSLSDLSASEIEGLVTLASQIEKAPIREDLKGKVVALLFMNPSLRTLASFQAGIAQLGGSSFVIQPGAGSWNLEIEDGAVMDGPAQEHIREAIPVLAAYCDILGIRCFAGGQNLEHDLADPILTKVVDLSPKPTVSLESGADHPCQALADWKTLDDLEVPKAGGRFVLSWAWHPKPLPFAVPQAALTMAAKRGMDVTILRPEGYDLPEPIMAKACAIAGGTIRTTRDVDEAMEGADVLYCKSWSAPDLYGDPEADLLRRADLRDWRVRESWFANARPDAKFMHCLPVRRNVKVDDEVLDGPRSVVIRQAANRLHGQKAVLCSIARGLGHA